MNPADHTISGSFLIAPLDSHLRAIDDMRDRQALRRVWLHRRMKEIHDLALECRESSEAVRIPLPPDAPDPAAKWCWNGEDFIALWQMLNEAMGRDIRVGEGCDLEEFTARVEDMNDLCEEIKARIEEAREQAHPSDEGYMPMESSIHLEGKWDAGLEAVGILWRAPAPNVGRLYRSVSDPYDPLIERLVAVIGPGTVHYLPNCMGPGVTIRLRLVSESENGQTAVSNVLSITRPVD